MASLLRVRRHQVLEARRAVAGHHAAEAEAERAAAEALAAIDAEAAADPQGASPAGYGTWLPRGLEARERSQATHALAARDTDQARHALTEARMAERAAEDAMARIEAEARTLAARKAGHALDDWVAGRPLRTR
jgi:hypothetical protein